LKKNLEDHYDKQNSFQSIRLNICK